MKRNPEYILQEVSGLPYLLPFGQNIIENRRGTQLNAVGALLWHALETERSRQELLQILSDSFHVPAENLPDMEKDLDDFLHPLMELGMIFPDSGSHNQAFSEHLKIGGLVLRFQGAESLFAPEFKPFVIADPGVSADQTIRVVTGRPPVIPLHKILLNSAELSLIDADDCFLLRFTDPFGPTECHLSKDGARATFYCPPTSHSVMQEKLFHCIRFTYLLLAQKRGLFMLHSASLLYRDRAWLFSGHSGAGKSTHTNMWKEHLNTPLLNGDLNLIELRSDGPVVHGIPWCGTSGISTTKSYPLGGIILLRQHCRDLCEKPASDKQTLLVMHRLISPAWTAEMLRTNLSFCDKLTKQIFVSRLFCTKSFSAVDLIQKEIDQYTEGILP